MELDLKSHLEKSLRQIVELWAKDLAAHRGDLIAKAAPTARSLADIAYETIVVNGIVAARLRGDTPANMEDFPTCPRSLASSEALSDAMRKSVEEVLASIGDPLRPIVRPNGETVTAYERGEFVAWHMMYHLGQLNYVQTVDGDVNVHWS